MEKTDNISSSKNKLVFEQENSSDDEVDHVEKKIKVVKTSPVRLETIFTSYQCKEYEICLKMIDEVLKQKLKEEQMEDPIFTQCRIVQAACWTLTNTNKVEARDQLTKILATEPKNSFAHYGFGLYHYHEGNMEAAIESFGRALSFDPSGEMMKALEFKAKSKGIMDMLYNAKLKFNENLVSQAVEMLNAAALIDPENDTIAKKIIRIRDEFMKDLILRLEDEIKKDFPDKCNDAEKLMITNQMAKAGKLVEQINLEEPNSARAFYVKGLLLYYKGDLKESFKLFKQASDLNPRMENAVRMRKKVKSLQELVDAATKEMNDKNYPKSIELFTKIIDTDKNNKLISQASHFHRALAYFNYGNFEESFEDYKSSEILKSVVGDVLKNIGTKGLKKKPEADDVKAINSSNIEKQKG